MVKGIAIPVESVMPHALNDHPDPAKKRSARDAPYGSPRSINGSALLQTPTTDPAQLEQVES